MPSTMNRTKLGRTSLNFNAITHGLERLDFHHIVSLRKARFCRRLVVYCSRICFGVFGVISRTISVKTVTQCIFFEVTLQLWTLCILIFMQLSHMTLLFVCVFYCMFLF